MSKYGGQISGSSSGLLVDDVNPIFALTQSFTKTMDGNGSIPLDVPQKPPFMVLARPSGSGQMYTQFAPGLDSEGNLERIKFAGSIHPVTSTLDILIFGPADDAMDSRPGYGFETYKPDGSLVFGSWVNHLQIVHAKEFSIPSNFISFSHETGRSMDLSHPSTPRAYYALNTIQAYACLRIRSPYSTVHRAYLPTIEQISPTTTRFRMNETADYDLPYGHNHDQTTAYNPQRLIIGDSLYGLY